MINEKDIEIYFSLGTAINKVFDELKIKDEDKVIFLLENYLILKKASWYNRKQATQNKENEQNKPRYKSDSL